MDFFKGFTDFIDLNLVMVLIPIILLLKLVEIIFQGRFATRKVLSLISWFIIAYSTIILVHFLISLLSDPNSSTIINRAIGPYRFAFWIMFFSSTVLPFTLVTKKLSSKLWYVLLVAFAIKIGMYFERFVITTTSFHRDHNSDSAQYNMFDGWIWTVFTVVLQSLVIVIMLLWIVKISNPKAQLE